MALIGSAAIAMWNYTQDPTETAHWHSREHLAERLSCPGFLRGRRMICVEGDRTEHFMLYELETLDVAESQPYLDKLNSPSEWSTRIMQRVIEHSRTTCILRRVHGIGVAPFALIGRFMLSTHTLEIDSMIDEFLSNAVELPSITGVSWLEKADSVTSSMTQEQVLRGKRDGTVPTTFLVEGYGEECLRDLAKTSIFNTIEPTDFSLKQFRLDHLVTSQDLHTA